MSEQKLDQETQVNKSDVYDDDRTPGPALETDAANVRDDLNALRTQVRKIMSGDRPTGDWKNNPATAFGPDISLEALHASGLGFDEDKILVSADGDVVIDVSGNVVRSDL